MVKMSDSLCLLEETSRDGASGSWGTATTPGAPSTAFSFEYVFSFEDVSASSVLAAAVVVSAIIAVQALSTAEESRFNAEQTRSGTCTSRKHTTAAIRARKQASSVF
jgi:hypothetical protein